MNSHPTGDSQAFEGLEAKAYQREVRRNLLLSTPALIVLFCAASGPLLIMLVFSFLTAGDYGGIKWQFSTEAWFQVAFYKDIFDETVTIADAHLSIFWRSVKLSFLTTLVAFLLGFPTAYFIATRPVETRNIWLFFGHHTVLDQSSDPHLCDSGNHPKPGSG